MRHTRVVVPHYGGPEVVTVIEEDMPIPNAGEVRVKVLAAGVSLPDVLAREGVHPETPRVPYTPGWDLVGTVDRLGKDMTGFELGQKLPPCPSTGAMRSTYAWLNTSLSPSLRDRTQRRQSPSC
jgi:NADPH:quinone reductase